MCRFSIFAALKWKLFHSQLRSCGGCCVTCHTTGSMWSAVVDKQTLSTSVCEAEVSTLAMMASRMENGSMVYTTNTMNRKKDTCGQRETTMNSRQRKTTDRMKNKRKSAGHFTACKLESLYAGSQSARQKMLKFDLWSIIHCKSRKFNVWNFLDSKQSVIYRPQADL